MTDGIRVLLVASQEDARRDLLALLESMEPIWVTEVCVAPAVAPRRVADLQPELTIMVVDPDRGESTAANLIQGIRKQTPEGTVLVINRPRGALASPHPPLEGTSEQLDLPVDRDVLLATIRRLTGREPVAPATRSAPTLPQVILADKHPGSRTIVVTGATGEVGCTTLAVNLATTLARTSGREVALADFELLFGAVDTLLDIAPENTLLEIVRSVDRLDSTLLKRMLCHHESGLAILPRPIELIEAANLTPESLGQTLALLQSTFGAVLIDTSKGLQTSDFIAFESADVILVVIQLEPTIVKQTAKLVECLRQFEGLAPRLQIVANRVGSLRTTVSLEAAEESLQSPITWQIPNATKSFHLARDRGVPLDAIAPRSDAQRMIATMARTLVPSLVPIEAKSPRGFFRDRLPRER